MSETIPLGNIDMARHVIEQLKGNIGLMIRWAFEEESADMKRSRMVRVRHPLTHLFEDPTDPYIIRGGTMENAYSVNMAVVRVLFTVYNTGKRICNHLTRIEAILDGRVKRSPDEPIDWSILSRDIHRLMAATRLNTDILKNDDKLLRFHVDYLMDLLTNIRRLAELLTLKVDDL